jgi:hypothetical protein
LEGWGFTPKLCPRKRAYQTAGGQFGQVDLSQRGSYFKCFTDFFMK